MISNLKKYNILKCIVSIKRTVQIIRNIKLDKTPIIL